MNICSKSFELSPVGNGAKWFFAGLILLPFLVTAGIFWHHFADLSSVPPWTLALSLGIGPAILIATAWGIKNPQAKLDKDGLSLKVSFINKRWALSDIDRANTTLVNLDTRRELRPKWKLWGAAMPGLRSGLFKLYDGRKAHVYLTERSKVVYLPTQTGPVLLSLERPREFLDTLQSL